MIRFLIFGFPVAIHWMFWVLAALISGALHATGRDAWVLVLAKILVVLVSILVHELGHASMQRRFGGRPSILLHGFGGQSHAPGQFTRNENLILVAMGPVFSLLLAVSGWLLWSFSLLPGTLAGFVILINVFWTTLNLLPIYPLDGAQLLEHAMRGRNPVLRYRIAMVTAALVAVYFLSWGWLFAGIVFGYMAYENYKRSEGRPVAGIFGRF
jgi:Zn-dependent protease